MNMRRKREGVSRLGKERLMQPSSVEDAIRELQLEVKRIQEALATLRRIQEKDSAAGGPTKRRGIRVSARAQRKVMQASRLARTEDRALNTLARVFSSL